MSKPFLEQHQWEELVGTKSTPWQLNPFAPELKEAARKQTVIYVHTSKKKATEFSWEVRLL
jgi:hypothetical protein